MLCVALYDDPIQAHIDNVDLDALGLCTSRTDKACLGDLLNSKCFIEEAEELVEEFLSPVF